MFDNFWKRFGSVFADNGSFLLHALGNTLMIALIGFAIGLVLGSIIALLKTKPNQNMAFRIVNKIFDIYVLIVRGTPIVVQLLLLYFGLLATLRLSAMTIAIIVIGFNSGAYLSETLRAAINSIDKGQLEAARAVGLSYGQASLKVVLPQAYKVAIPALGNEIITLIKETAVVGFITVIDITRAAQSIVASSYDAVVPYIVLALIYLVIVYLLTLTIKLVEKKVFAHG